MLLARLLDPADFGLVAMVMAIVGVADLVRDFGMTGAILQARALTRAAVVERAVVLASLLGGGLMIIVAACAPLIAALYDEQQLWC